MPAIQCAFGPRTLIIGNSGCGKTVLARHISAVTACPHLDLDTVYWDGAAGVKKRVEPAAKQLTAEASDGPCWVIEGVYGWLADMAAPRATSLIWLNLPWSDCKAGLEARGPACAPSRAEYEDLLAWAEAYSTRQTSSSDFGHRRIFDAFTAEKHELRTRHEVAEFVTARTNEQRAVD